MRNSLTSLITPGMTYGTLRGIAERLGIDVHSGLLPDDLCGYYVCRRNEIVIDRTMSYREKRCTLVHELCHWSHEDEFKGGVIDARIENRARRETASLLISPTEYAMAENTYEAQVKLIAAELDVTRQVVEDYQYMVLSRLANAI